MPTPTRWHHHFFYRKECFKTTWKLRLSLLVLVGATVALTRGFWTTRIAASLTCEEETAPSDALVLENFDPNYLVFERAESLQRAGVAKRIFVPALAAEGGVPNAVEKGTVELMARIARLPSFEVIPIREVEPISLNAAREIRDALAKEKVKSVVVVTPGLRSRRSSLVYRSVLVPAGIRVQCVPVFGTKTAENWTHTWHGIQEVVEQFFKLQYYRFWVLW